MFKSQLTHYFHILWIRRNSEIPRLLLTHGIIRTTSQCRKRLTRRKDQKMTAVLELLLYFSLRRLCIRKWPPYQNSSLSSRKVLFSNYMLNYHPNTSIFRVFGIEGNLASEMLLHGHEASSHACNSGMTLSRSSRAWMCVFMRYCSSSAGKMWRLATSRRRSIFPRFQPFPLLFPFFYILSCFGLEIL